MPVHSECDCNGCKLLAESVNEVKALLRSIDVNHVVDIDGCTVLPLSFICMILCHAMKEIIEEHSVDYNEIVANTTASIKFLISITNR